MVLHRKPRVPLSPHLIAVPARRPVLFFCLPVSHRAFHRTLRRSHLMWCHCQLGRPGCPGHLTCTIMQLNTSPCVLLSHLRDVALITSLRLSLLLLRPLITHGLGLGILHNTGWSSCATSFHCFQVSWAPHTFFDTLASGAFWPPTPSAVGAFSCVTVAVSPAA